MSGVFSGIQARNNVDSPDTDLRLLSGSVGVGATGNESRGFTLFTQALFWDEGVGPGAGKKSAVLWVDDGVTIPAVIRWISVQLNGIAEALGGLHLSTVHVYFRSGGGSKANGTNFVATNAPGAIDGGILPLNSGNGGFFINPITGLGWTRAQIFAGSTGIEIVSISDAGAQLYTGAWTLDGFYWEPPLVISLSVISGPTAGGNLTNITCFDIYQGATQADVPIFGLTKLNFSGGALSGITIRFGGALAVFYNTVGSGEALLNGVEVPPHAAGFVDVTIEVFYDDGTSTIATLVNGYEYIATSGFIFLPSPTGPPVEYPFSDGGVVVDGGFAGLLSLDISGIYEITPGKTNDTLYARSGSTTSVDVAIPDPFADTGFIGDGK